MTTITSYFFGKDSEGNAVNHYVIENSKGAKVVLSQLGAAIVSIIFPDKNGEMKDVVLGYNNIHGYETGEEYFGETVGRCCGRIQNARFILNGKEYFLPKNNGKNHLYGGIKGFSRKVWDCDVQDDKVIFSLHSADGEEGYPGNMTVTVTYLFDDDCKLYIHYKAVSDKDTICNLTNHSYFNLNGNESGNICGYTLQIYADNYLPLTNTLIPVGESEKVENSPFDFRNGKSIWEDINKNHSQLVIAKGFDHSFVLKKRKKVLVLQPQRWGIKAVSV